MLRGAKWMFCSYVNGHSPDERDKNKAACLAMTHDCMAAVWVTSPRHLWCSKTNTLKVQITHVREEPPGQEKQKKDDERFT